MKRGQYNKNNPSHFDFGASLRKPAGDAIFGKIFRQYTYNAKRKGLVFKLSKKFARSLIESNCFYCGISPARKALVTSNRGFYYFNGIDRVDNKKGYISSNCVSACVLCNNAKSNLSLKEWNAWVERIMKFQANKEPKRAI